LPESRQLRRAKLTEAVRRHRGVLRTMKYAEERAPLAMKEGIASRIQEIAEELRRMESELHDLNVQQIREELAGG